jgi:hypothetical protein
MNNQRRKSSISHHMNHSILNPSSLEREEVECTVIPVEEGDIE